MAETLDLRHQVISTCRQMNGMGLNQGQSGNVSVRNGDGFLISPSGVPYDSMIGEQIVQMRLDGSYAGDVLPSSEWQMHLDVYRTRPEAGAVIHVHSPHATALACLRRDIPAFHYMIAVAGGTSLRCAAYRRYGTKALSDAMLLAMDGRTACLLANHGMICFAQDLPKALHLAMEIETLCKQYILACQCGTPVLLSEAEMAQVLEHFGSYGKQPDELARGDSAAFELPSRRD